MSVLSAPPLALSIPIANFLKECVDAAEQQCLKLGLQVLSSEAFLSTLHTCSASSWWKKIRINYK